MNSSIITYHDFAAALDEIGFMPLSNNILGFPNLSAMTEESQWHTGLETDPWQWKTRIVNERRAASAKLFCGKPSFITREWYPVFLAARRCGRSFEEVFEGGTVSRESAKIYALFDERKRLAVHEIKQLADLDKSNVSRYESAMVELQMGMFLTICGNTRKTTLTGEPHGWPVIEYMRVEDWAWEDALEKSAGISQKEAAQRIIERVMEVVPGADVRKVRRFVEV